MFVRIVERASNLLLTKRLDAQILALRKCAISPQSAMIIAGFFLFYFSSFFRAEAPAVIFHPLFCRFVCTGRAALCSRGEHRVNFYRILPLPRAK